MEIHEKNTGLTTIEAEKYLLKYGNNVLVQKRKKSPIEIFFGQFKDVMTLVLVACTGVSAFMKDWIEAAVMIGIVIINAFFGFIQEYKTEKTLDALKSMTAMRANVLRDGKVQNIKAEFIVPGDVVEIRRGDVIPADGILLQGRGILIDESMLTGESVSVEKNNANANEKMLFSGTMMVGGSGVMLVTETGMNTKMGKISDMIQNVEEETTPLQKRLAKMGKYIVLACLVVCIVVTVTGVLRGEGLIEMMLTGISLAVAAVPEGLPAIVTISLALGVKRMAEHNALVKKLPAVETLGSTTVICSDKTGTLTQNKMTLKETYSLSDMMPLVFRLCNNQSDATEFALKDIGGDLVQNETEKYSRIDEIPFDSKRKYMSVTVKSTRGDIYQMVKGGADVVLSKCTYFEENGKIKQMDSKSREKFKKQNEYMASKALRVLSAAYRKVTQEEARKINSENTNNLIFVGFAGLIDPPREEAANAIEMCNYAGIRTVMITGDHKDTARAIAEEINMPDVRVMTGDEIEKISDAELQKKVKDINVFARVLPEHKLRIVRAFRKNKNIVAMTGDGVNDAPAVKEADIGISMGMGGTDVTREASDMILTDDNFATIVESVKQGRGIYENIRKFIRYMLACNLGEVITMFAAMLAGLPLPLYPIQILWVNSVTDGLPGIALGLDPVNDDIMRKKPVPVESGLFSGRLPFLILFRGFLIGLCTLGAFCVVYLSGGNLEEARTVAFLTLVMTQLVHSFECRSESKSFFKSGLRGNLLLLSACAFSFLMMVAVIYIPVLQGVFNTTMLNTNRLILVFCFTAIGPIVGGIVNEIIGKFFLAEKK